MLRIRISVDMTVQGSDIDVAPIKQKITDALTPLTSLWVEGSNPIIATISIDETSPRNFLSGSYRADTHRIE